jgi:hypothetical protein
VGCLAALLGLVADPPPTEAPWLWRLGLSLVAIGTLAANARFPWASRVGVVLAGLGLFALVGRNQALAQSPWRLTHQEFLGVPPHLAWMVLAAGAHAIALHPASRPARVAVLLGTLGGLGALGWPGEWLGVVRPGLAWAGDAFGSPWIGDRQALALLWLLLLPTLGGAWLAAAPWLPRRMAPPPWVGRLAGVGVVLLGCHHLLASFSAGTGLGGLATGLAVAAALSLGSLVGARALVAPHPGEGARWARGFDLGFPAVVLVLYALLKTHGMGASDTDENIYFYMAWDLAENGRWPYLDSFFAHPPLHVMLPAGFFWVFGYSLTLAKLFSATAAGVAGLAVWAIGRQHLGRPAAALAMLAMLSATEVLKASTNMTGVNLTTAWLMLGVWQAMKGHPGRAGLLFAAAAGTGLYSMGAICAALCLGFFQGWRLGAAGLGAFALALGGLNLAFYLAAGDAFLDGVYRYHEAKTFQDPRMVSLFDGDQGFLAGLWQNLRVMVAGLPFTKEVFYHAHLWLALALLPLVAVAGFAAERPPGTSWWRLVDPRRGWQNDPHGRALYLGLVCLALFIQYSLFRELYSFYFMLIYPFLALCLGYVVTGAVRLVVRALHEPTRWPARLAGALALPLCALQEPWSAAAGRAAFPDETEELGRKNDYRWTPAPVLASASATVRELFWEDERWKGDGVPGHRHYQWNKKRQFVLLDEIAAAVREGSSPDETLAGASTLAPLIALQAGRRLAGGEADTNQKRFRVGMLDERSYWEAICRDRVRFLVAGDRSHFTEPFLNRLPTARRWFELHRVFMEPGLMYGGEKRIALYARREVAPPAPGQVCRWEER